MRELWTAVAPLLVAVSDACRGGWLSAEVSCLGEGGLVWLARAGVLACWFLPGDAGALASGVGLRRFRLSGAPDTKWVL